MANTLICCIEQLKPIQQEYIVHCVKEYLRKDFHRGLLPFLSVEDAIRCLKRRYEMLKSSTSNAQLWAGKGVPFIRRLIELLERYSTYVLHEDETSVTMRLKDVKLAKAFGRRFAESFVICLRRKANDHNLSVAQLKQIKKNVWKVTCHPTVLDKVTLYLAFFQ